MFKTRLRLCVSVLGNGSYTESSYVTAFNICGIFWEFFKLQLKQVTIG